MAFHPAARYEDNASAQTGERSMRMRIVNEAFLLCSFDDMGAAPLITERGSDNLIQPLTEG